MTVCFLKNSQKVTRWPKTTNIFNQNVDVKKASKTEQLGDNDATGMAACLAWFEVYVSVIVLVMTNTYLLGFHAALHLILIILMARNLFVSLIIICYVSFLEACEILIIAFGVFAEYPELIPSIMPKPEGNGGLIGFGILAFLGFCWCLTRLHFTRRALYFVNLNMELAKENDDVDLEAALKH